MNPLTASSDICTHSLSDNGTSASEAPLSLTRLDSVGVLRCEGPDAAQFLQNRCSNDVMALAEGQGQWNAVLDRQGKIQGVFELYCTAPDAFLLLLEQSVVANTQAQIEKFHILEQFQLSDCSAQYTVVLLLGSQAEAFVSRLGLQSDELPTQDFQVKSVTWQEQAGWIIRQRHFGRMGFYLILPIGLADALMSQCQALASDFQANALSEEQLEALRIEAGRPKYGVDYDFDTLLPETGLEKVAVSYTKGCYLGQETIARVKTYGMVQQALMGLVFSESSTTKPLAGDCFIAGHAQGQKIGRLTSSVFSPTLKRWIALAYLGKQERVPGKPLLLEIQGHAYEATVTLLPFVGAEASASVQSPEAQLQEALTLFSQGEEATSIELLQALIQQAPEMTDAYEALGVILSRQNRYEEAIALMNQILEMDPSHVLAHTNLSVFYMKLGNIEKAEEEKAKATMAAFQQKAKAAGLVPNWEAEQRKKEQALEERAQMFQEALALNPTDPLGNYGLGSTLLELKRYAEAIPPLQKAIEIQPKHSVAYLSLAKCLYHTENSTQSRDVLEKGIGVAAAKGDLMPLKEMQRLQNEWGLA